MVCSGFFDSIGLYQAPSKTQEREAVAEISRLGLEDLVSPQGQQLFCTLSHGQQKLVLLVRAMVKRPRLLLLDEPSHGLSGANRDRLLAVLGALAADPRVAIVYVTHRQDEVQALRFANVLRLTKAKQVPN